MKPNKFISYSLFPCADALRGAGYLAGIYKNITRARACYPKGWSVAVFVDRRMGSYIESLTALGATVTAMPENVGMSGLLWRVLPLTWEGVERVVFRDADSQVTKREGRMVDAWEKSGKSLHLIHDHPKHTSPVMAGTWGVVRNEMTALMARTMPLHADAYGDDELALQGVLNMFQPDDIFRSGETHRHHAPASNTYVGNRHYKYP